MSNYMYYADRNAEIIAGAFREQIRTIFGSVDVHVDAEYIRTTPCGAIIFHAIITPLGKFDADQISVIANAVWTIGARDDDGVDVDLIDGNEQRYTRRFVLGDGDDSGACWMRGGVVYAWIRYIPDHAADVPDESDVQRAIADMMASCEIESRIDESGNIQYRLKTH